MSIYFIFYAFHKILVEFFSSLWGSSVNKAWTISFSAISIQCKLWNHKNITINVIYRQIYFIIFIWKNTQIYDSNTYINEYEYTHSGILKALIYFFEIKGNSIDKANGGIGIVPYIYKDAYNYYYAQWQAQQKNIHKPIQQYIPQVKEIVIPPPQRQIKKRKQFTFLDKEDW